MRPAVLIGALLIALGVIALAYQGFSYTKREKVIDIGPIEATAETKEHVALPPILGIVAVGAGVVLLLAGKKS
jgi:hypothetical protein